MALHRNVRGTERVVTRGYRSGGVGQVLHPGQVVVRAHQGGPVAGSIAGLIGGDVGSDLGDQGGFDRQVEQARSLCSRAGGD